MKTLLIVSAFILAILPQCSKAGGIGHVHQQTTINSHTTIQNIEGVAISMAAAMCDAEWNTSRLQACVGAANYFGDDALSGMVAKKFSDEGIMLKGMVSCSHNDDCAFGGSANWRF